jgi:glycosyltransferase involved in cell wall biosynthesis
MTVKPSVQVAFLADYGKSYGKGLEILSIVEAARRMNLGLRVHCRDSTLTTSGERQISIERHLLGAAPYRAFSWYGRKFAPDFKARLAQERLFDKAVARKVDGDIGVFFGVPRLTRSFRRARALGMTTVLHAVELAPGHMRNTIRDLYGGVDYETNILGGEYIAESEATLEYIDYVFCHTEFSKKTYVEQGIPAEKIKVFPMGGNHINPGAIPARDYAGIANRKLKLIYVGNITRAKGIHLLIDAANQLNGAGVELHLCGDAESDFQGALTASYRPGSNVIFHGNVDPRPHYAAADLFVFPTLSDSFGRVVVEAASYGLPCIATETGNASLVEHGKTGLLIEPSVASLVEALQAARASGSAMNAWSAEISRRAATLTMDRFGENNIYWLAQIAGK